MMMVGSCSYDILADRDNARDLQYIPHHYPERTKYLPTPHNEFFEFDDGKEEQLRTKLETADKVRLAVDLAYLDEVTAKELSFRFYDGESILHLQESVKRRASSM